MAKMSAPSIVVHHLSESRSHRVLWLLEELELPYTIKVYQRLPNKLAPPELKQIHPLGKSPVLVDDGLVVAESGAIIEYLIEKYGKGSMIPDAGSSSFLQYKYFLHYAEGSVMPQLLLRLVFDGIVKRVPCLIRPIMNKVNASVSDLIISPNLSAHFGFIEQHLAANEWFAGGTITGADIQMMYPIIAAADRCAQFVGAKTLAWLDRVKQRPAFKAALDKGGPIIIE